MWEGMSDSVCRQLGSWVDIIAVSKMMMVLGRFWNLQTPEALPKCLLSTAHTFPDLNSHMPIFSLYTNLARANKWLNKMGMGGENRREGVETSATGIFQLPFLNFG